MIFYYSGCGNSRYVAETLAAAGGEKLVFIPQAACEGLFDYALQADERLGFVFPIYSWRPPQLVLDFVSRLRLQGSPSYTYMVSTYGDGAGWADKVMGEALASVGLQLDAVFGVVMPNTYVNMSFMKLDTAELAQQKLANSKKRVAELAKAIAERQKAVDIVRGGMPNLKTYFIGKGFNRWLSDKDYYVTDACISCGKCAEVCPLQNITLEGGKPRWHGHCTQCEACYHYCPRNAVQFGKATRGKGQYHFAEDK